MTPTDVAGLDARIVALTRRWGRGGINESTMWTVLRAEVNGLRVDECGSAVNRLIREGRLYRHHRKTRTMIHVSGATPAPTVPDHDPEDLFSTLPERAQHE